MQRKFFRLWIFAPLLGSVTTVLASPMGQVVTQEQKNSETLNQIISIVIGGVLTLILGFIQRSQLKTNRRVETVAAASVPREDYDALKLQIDSMQTDLGILVTQRELVGIAEEQKKTTTAILQVAKSIAGKQDTVIEKVDSHITAITDYRTAVNNSIVAHEIKINELKLSTDALTTSTEALKQQIAELIEDKATCAGMEEAVNNMRDEIVRTLREQQVKKTAEVPAVSNVIDGTTDTLPAGKVA